MDKHPLNNEGAKIYREYKNSHFVSEVISPEDYIMLASKIYKLIPWLLYSIEAFNPDEQQNGSECVRV